jgi:hypothetical protein
MRYAFIILFLLPSVLWASPAEEPVVKGIPILDSAQDLFGSRANFAANNIDSFFANQRADDELGRSNMRIRTLYNMRERALPKDDIQVRFNLRLPELEEKFHIRYVGMDGKEDPNIKKKIQKDPNLIRVIPRPKPDTPWLFRSDTGVNVSIKPRVFARSRLRKTVQTGTIIHRFALEGAWFSNEGFIQSIDFSNDQTITDNVLFRFSNTQKWQISDQDFITAHGPSIYQRISDNDAIAYGYSAGTRVDHSSRWYLTNHQVYINYRRNIYHNWIFFDVTPGIDWPKEWSFRRTPFILLQLEALFGYQKR